MKLIIAGGRTLEVHPLFIDSAILALSLNPSEVVSGGAKGIDAVGELWADEYWNVPIKRFEAEWEEYGKAAGPIRNAQMAAYADALLLIWDGESRGSANMRRQMEQLKKPIYEVILKRPI